MEKILFVCLGNICRSPLAEGIMLHLKEKHQLLIEVDSAGTANYHVGESPDKRTVANAIKHGLDISTLRARQFEPIDFDKFDRILVMDESNLKNVLLHTNKPEHIKKVSLFLKAANNPLISEVPDPYYGDESVFDQVFRIVYEACEQLGKELKRV